MESGRLTPRPTRYNDGHTEKIFPLPRMSASTDCVRTVLSAALESCELPATGRRLKTASSPGACRSAAVTALLQQARAQNRMAVLICADAFDVARLSQEIAWLDPSLKVSCLPDWETLPYDTMSPHADLVSERLETLYNLTSADKRMRPDVLIAAASTAAQRFAPRAFVAGNTFFFKKGQTISTKTLEADLVAAGYGRVEQTMAPGEFAVRGGIVDIFPMGAASPLRLDLFDDEIDAIRTFDPETQHSTGAVDEIRILPGHEFAFDEEARNRFRAAWRAAFAGDPNKCPVYKDVGQGICSAGIEYYLPLFFTETGSLADYLPENALFVTLGKTREAFLRQTEERYKFLSHDKERPALPPERLFDKPDDFFNAIGPFGRVSLSAPETGIAEPLTIERSVKDPAEKLKTFIAKCAMKKERVLIAATGSGRAARLQELLREGVREPDQVESFPAFLESKAPVAVAVGPVSGGFELAGPGIVLVTETELYNTRAMVRRRGQGRTTNVEAIIRDVSELREGDPVVHAAHGVGRYHGLETIQGEDGPADFVRIDYANEAKLFVPVSQLNLISRYTGADSEHAPLNNLGRGDWEKARRKAAEKVRDTAAELLHLYALRQAKQGYAFATDTADYQAFCEGFAFEETPDQAAAIAAVIEDMHAGRPMDRLVCGDVGFGKTEVALRAAFIAVMNGKQVAVLCPTTLLAEQHAQTFKDRFAAWPVKVAELSRFRTSKQTTETIEGLTNGSVDIVIGTHKLLSESVAFKRLGLVVIDEEHRFGVRQKEKLKSLRAEVDVLTLTATPIPRTLAMSLEGIRDFSVIATAPQKRLAIKTFVRRESNALIREAIIRELKRGGQVYFLHNDVDTIGARAEMLAELVPEARIGIAHGQMGERELERVMREFYRREFNVLVCTTIIETGIDIPIANTIIMHRADKFGLAQLHQLRGRVGRSHHQAYAYLLIPDVGAITKNAERRLEAIQNLEELGSGFYLSMHDLEIRGAGEVLGDEQSGEMAQVGFELYSQMLKQAVDAMKDGHEPDLESPFETLTEINLHLPALLPEDYVPDVGTRLSLYKRLAAARTLDELGECTDDLTDRFGSPVPAAKTLLAVHRLRIECAAVGIRKIDAADEAVVFTFAQKTFFDPAVMFALLQKRRDLRVLPGTFTRLRMTAKSNDAASRLQNVRTVVNALVESLPPELKP